MLNVDNSIKTLQFVAIFAIPFHSVKMVSMSVTVASVQLREWFATINIEPKKLPVDSSVLKARVYEFAKKQNVST